MYLAPFVVSMQENNLDKAPPTLMLFRETSHQAERVRLGMGKERSKQKASSIMSPSSIFWYSQQRMFVCDLASQSNLILFNLVLKSREIDSFF